jgi:class 3 adenylate cyclase
VGCVELKVPISFFNSIRTKYALRIGLDFGEALVVPYGKILIGSSISIAAKIVSVAQPNQVLIGESIYNINFFSRTKQ